MSHNETSSLVRAELLSSCNSFRTADRRSRAVTHWPKREDTSWRLDSLMSRLVSRQHRRKSSLSLLSRPERMQRRSRRLRLLLAIVASADSGERRRRDKRTRRVLAGQIASSADVTTCSSWSAKLSTSVSGDVKSSDDNKVDSKLVVSNFEKLRRVKRRVSFLHFNECKLWSLI